MPILWITYAWSDAKSGDFPYLVEELKKAGVQAKYDRIALIPGRDLWEQIASQITQGSLDGWAYLMTKESLSSEPCKEELAYALNRAISTKGRDFPLIGLLHGVRIEDVPPALKVRLCVSLASPNWKGEVRAGLLNKPPAQRLEESTRFVWSFHNQFRGNAQRLAIEVRPRFGEVTYWRFAVPAATKVIQFGHGPAGTGALSPMQTMVIEGGTGDINGQPFKWFGAGDKITQGTSAYAIIEGPIPSLVGFSDAADAYGPPLNCEIRQLHA